MSKSKKTKALKIAIPTVAAVAVAVPAAVAAAGETVVVCEGLETVTVPEGPADSLIDATFKKYSGPALPDAPASCGGFSHNGADSAEQGQALANQLARHAAEHAAVEEYNSQIAALKETYGNILTHYISLGGAFNNETLTFAPHSTKNLDIGLWNKNKGATEGGSIAIANVTGASTTGWAVLFNGSVANNCYTGYALSYLPSTKKLSLRYVQSVSLSGIGDLPTETEVISKTLSSDLTNLKIDFSGTKVNVTSNDGNNTEILSADLTWSVPSATHYGIAVDGNAEGNIQFSGIGYTATTAAAVNYAKAPTLDSASANVSTVAKGTAVTVTLKGADTDSGDSIQIVRSVDGGAWAEVGNPVTSTQAQQTLTDSVATTSLSAGSHTVKYKLVDAAGNESGEKQISFTVVEAAAAPTTTLTGGDGQVIVSWNAVPGADSYSVFYRKNSAGQWAEVPNLSGTSYTLKGLESGTSYQCVVRAKNAAGYSAWNESTSPTALTLPALPKTTATAGDAKITLSWTAVTGASSYNVCYRANSTGQWSKIPDLTGTSYTLTGLTNGTPYQCIVRAANATGECSWDENNAVSATPKAATVAVTGVTLNKSTLALTTGGSDTLTATVAPTNATNKTVTWASSDTSVATVSNGKVTAVKAGTATITATCDGKSASCTVTITDPVVAVTGVTLNKSTLSLAEGGSEILVASITPANATNKTVTWGSSDSSVATVSNGKVIAVKAGTATITAKSGDKSATCVVTVTAKTSGSDDTDKSNAPVVKITSTNKTFYLGEDIKFSLSIEDDDESDTIKLYRSIDGAAIDESKPIATIPTFGSPVTYADTIDAGLAVGDHTIEYTAIDSKGNKAASDTSAKLSFEIEQAYSDDSDPLYDSKNAAIKEINEYADKADTTIDNVEGASQSDKDKAKSDIDDIVDNAVAAIIDADEEDVIDATVSTAKTNIDKIVDGVKSSASTSGGTSDKEDPLEDEKDDANKAIDELADSAKDVIDESGLTDSEKDKAKDEIDDAADKAKSDVNDAKSTDDINKILEDFAKKIAEILSEIADKSIGSNTITIPEIDIDIPFPDVDPSGIEDKIKDWLEEILKQLQIDLENADSPEDIQKAIDKALEALEKLKEYINSVNDASSDITNYYNKIKDLINDMSGLSSSEKNELMSKIETIIKNLFEDIENADSAEEVEKLLKEAMEAIKSLYEFAQSKNDAYTSITKYVETIKSIISDMDDLSSTDKAEYEEQIDKILEEMLQKLESATTQDEIDKIVADAKERIDAILKEAQSNESLSDSKAAANTKLQSIVSAAKDSINKLENLTESEKSKYKSEIEEILNSALKDIANAKTQEEIDKVVSEAQTAINKIVNNAEYQNDSISAAPELYISDIESDTFEAGSPIKVTLKVTEGDKDEKVSVYYEIDGKKEQLVEKFTSKGKATTIEATLPSDLSVGEHEVIFYAVDEEDNYSNKTNDIELEDLDEYKASKDKANMITLKIVNTPAEVGITSIPSTIKEGEDVSVNLSVKDNAGQTVKVFYQVDNAWPVAVGDYTSNGTAVPVNFKIPGLKEGTHVLTFYAEDNLGMKSNANGNVSASTLFGSAYNRVINQATITVEPASGTKDTTTNSAPNVDILTSTKTFKQGEDVTINLAVLDKNPNQTVTSYYSVDNGGANMIKSYISDGKTNAQSFKVNDLGVGTHTINVWATDDSGAKSDEFNSITITITANATNATTTVKPSQSGTIKTGVVSTATAGKGIFAAIAGGIATLSATVIGIVRRKRND